ncbi:MAG: four helix bundle protein [Melioribacteraceae bacterium]|nr:four helix bundle protein [Melioribacteraceae bacterium]
MIKSINDLEIYQTAYDLALKIHKMTIDFPKEEKYSLTDQIRRSSRSVAINIREGFAKRKYENIFIRHLVDALGSSEETRGWLNFSKDLGYIDVNIFIEMDNYYDQLNSKLHKTITTWKTF